MSYCLNPSCSKPDNLDDTTFCRNCGTKLLLDNRYRATKFLGAGGMGSNFLAVDERTPSKKRCVIKQFSPHPKIQSEPSTLQKYLELFNREAAVLDCLGDESSQIPRLLAYLEQDKRLYFVQEFIDGHNLFEELQQCGTYSEAQIYLLLNELLPVLKFIHSRGVIHRDIKPDNIMRRRDGQLVLIDFGISKQLSGAVIAPGTKGGTEGYAPLEQLRYGVAYPASDVYALGATCIHLLTDVLPDELFDPLENRWLWRDKLASRGASVSSHLGQILDKMLQENHEQRYQSVEELLAELNSQPQPSQLPPLPPPPQPLPPQQPQPLPLSKQPQPLPPQQPQPPHNNKLKITLLAAGAVVVLGLGGYGYWQSLPCSTASKCVEQGKAHWKQRNNEAALQAFNRALQLDSNFADAYNWRGLIRSNLGDKQTALEDYNRAIQLDPKLASAYCRRGGVRADLGEKEAGLEDCNYAIQLDPNDPRNYHNRGIVRSELDDKQGALEDYNQAIKLDPKFILAYNSRGNVRYNLGDKQGALEDYNQAIQLDPKYTVTYKGRGMVRYKLGDKQGALEDYNQAIQLDPKYTVAYIFRGAVRYNLGDKQGALEDYNQAIQLDSKSTDAYAFRGKLRYSLSDKQGALEDYNQAIQLDPKNAVAYRFRGDVLSALGDKQGAIKDFQQAAELYQQKGTNEDYQEVLKKIKEIQP